MPSRGLEPRVRVRVRVTGGPYKGHSGTLVRPDGTLHGQPGWMVKLDNSTFIETRYMVEARS